MKYVQRIACFTKEELEIELVKQYATLDSYGLDYHDVNSSLYNQLCFDADVDTLAIEKLNSDQLYKLNISVHMFIDNFKNGVVN